MCAKASHGDTLHICLYPGNMEECFQFTYQAFDLAERFQTPVFVVSDLDLGMQNWISKPFAYPEAVHDRGKVLDQAALAEIKDWGRYKDPDGDGIPYRTLPGTPGGKGAYFTRGTGHNVYGLYSEKPEDFQYLVDRLKRKFFTAKAFVPKPILSGPGCARGILAYGSSDPAVVEARDILRDQHGKETDYLRVRALPFTDDVIEFIRTHEVVYLVEQNRDAQMAGLLKDFHPELATRLHPVLHYDSTAIPAQTIVDQINACEQ
jgi:2-oxoglutarate ferredoxin oxidoreductase subunit alpha